MLGVDQDDGLELTIAFSSLEVIGGLHENCSGGVMEKMLVWREFKTKWNCRQV